jgi:RNA polymerase sigma-70 factor (ECF subfamily)
VATERSDEQLAAAILDDGDEAAFRALYRRHTPRLLAFVHRLLGQDVTEAEDVVQETWIRACDGLARFRWDSKFATWLTGIGLNTARERLTKRGRTSAIPADVSTEPTVVAGPGEKRVDLERSIRLLPEGYRTVLLLHDVEGLKHGEIARRLGISTGTSKSQLFSARRALRTLLCAPSEIGHD